MLFTIDRDPLLKALSHINGAIESRNTVPIYANVLLSAGLKGLNITGAGMDLQMSCMLEAEIETKGGITVPARTLLDVARNTPTGAQIRVSYDAASDPRVKIKAGRANTALPTLPATDFPIMEKLDGVTPFKLLKSDLTRLIDKTLPAASTEETRYYLNGTYFHTITEDGSTFLRSVGTNGHWLALADIPAPEGADGSGPVIFPRKALALARKMADAEGDLVEIAYTTSKIMVRVGNLKLVANAITGSFPDYGRVIPSGTGNTIVEAKASEVAAAITRVGVMHTSKSRALRLNMSQENGLLISARGDDGAEADDLVTTKQTGENFEVGFAATYLSAVTGLIGDGQIIMHLTNPANPCRIHDASDPGVTFVLMPLRV